MALKVNRNDQLFSSIQEGISSPQFDLSAIKSDLYLVLNDEGFFDLMLSQLTRPESHAQVNAILILSFMIIEYKEDVNNLKNEEAFELIDNLIKKNNIDITIDELKARL